MLIVFFFFIFTRKNFLKKKTNKICLQKSHDFLKICLHFINKYLYIFWTYHILSCLITKKYILKQKNCKQTLLLLINLEVKIQLKRLLYYYYYIYCNYIFQVKLLFPFVLLVYYKIHQSMKSRLHLLSLLLQD